MGEGTDGTSERLRGFAARMERAFDEHELKETAKEFCAWVREFHPEPQRPNEPTRGRKW